MRECSHTLVTRKHIDNLLEGNVAEYINSHKCSYPLIILLLSIYPEKIILYSEKAFCTDIRDSVVYISKKQSNQQQ